MSSFHKMDQRRLEKCREMEIFKKILGKKKLFSERVQKQKFQSESKTEKEKGTKINTVKGFPLSFVAVSLD